MPRMTGSKKDVLREYEKKQNSTKKRMSGRWVFGFGAAITFFCMLLILALFQLQFNEYELYAREASALHWKKFVTQPERGDILDVKGNMLASSTYVYTVGITPKDLKSTLHDPIDQKTICRELAIILEMDESKILEEAKKTDLMYTELKKGLTREKKDELDAFRKKYAVGGISVDSVARRFYPNQNLASQLIGYTNSENGLLIGQLGLELQYNNEITGQPGYTYAEVDVNANALPYSSPTMLEAQHGYHLQLYLDMNIQKITEEICRDLYEIYEVKGGVNIIVMNPNTGAIYANANYPDFNPNQPFQKPDILSQEEWDSFSQDEKVNFTMSELWRNGSVSDANEPGSTFKSITTAMAFEESVAAENEYFSDESISYPGSNQKISCSHESGEQRENHGMETLAQAFARSCNPIFVQLSQRLESNRFYEYVESFGFTEKTGIDLPGEGLGLIYPDGNLTPSKMDMYTLSIGESATVTPIQLISAYGAIANGGNLMRPQVAKALLDEDRNIVKEFTPQVRRTVISEKTAKRVSALMEEVIINGTAQSAKISGYKLAGKTGTSTFEIGRDAGKHVLSFGAFAPSNNPEVVVLVVLDRPEDNDLSSEVPAKAASIILERTLSYLGIMRDYKDNEDFQYLTNQEEIPYVIGQTYKEAKKDIYRRGLSVIDAEENIPDDAIITAVFPGEGTRLYTSGRIGKVVLSISSTPVLEEDVIPNFAGKTLEEVFEEAYRSNLNIVIEGDTEGFVVSQEIYSYTDEPADDPDPDENTEENNGENEPITENADAGLNEAPVKNTKRASVGTLIRVTME